MQEASFRGLVNVIIFVIGFYYLVKILARIFMPIIMKNMMEKAQENFNRHYQQGNFNQQTNQDFNTPKKEGNPISKKQVGEYIDYEEID
ncbi:DUF4834 family protein [Flavobacterium amniphilum]|uniref:DUF4834 family protein n=1 Tax=Flavobacterium amniphilum TaxID=1834035 RepID=UPI00202A6AE7|nr:DUF4834 family protein [Flavobacterium amniphilum]MCL9807276.1 DUF4834 family protein [Flavobacterium amniphilum]